MSKTSSILFGGLGIRICFGFRISDFGFLALLGLLLASGPAYAQEPDREFFETKIRPALVENCFKCHTGKRPKADLLLDSRSSMLTGSDNGPTIVPGSPEKSLL